MVIRMDFSCQEIKRNGYPVEHYNIGLVGLVFDANNRDLNYCLGFEIGAWICRLNMIILALGLLCNMIEHRVVEHGGVLIGIFYLLLVIENIFQAKIQQAHWRNNIV
jgi:hypothetical protein